MIFIRMRFGLVTLLLTIIFAQARAQYSEVEIDSLIAKIPQWKDDELLEGFQTIRDKTIALPEAILLLKASAVYESAKRSNLPLTLLCARLLVSEANNRDNTGHSTTAFIDVWLEFQNDIGKDSVALAYGHCAMSQAYLNTQFFLKSFEHAEFARIIFEQEKNNLMTLKARYLIFVICYSINPQLAYSEGLNLVHYFERTHDLPFLSVYKQTGFFNGMGLLARKLNQLDESVNCFDIGLDLASKNNFEAIKSLLTGNRGHSLFKMGDYETGLKAIREDVRSSDRLGLPVSKANALITMAQIKIAQHQADSSRYFFSQINVAHGAEGFDVIRYLELSHMLAALEGRYRQAYEISLHVTEKKDSVARYLSNFDFNRQRRELALSVRAADYHSIVVESARKSFLMKVEIGFIVLLVGLFLIMTIYLRTRQKYLRNIKEEMRLNEVLTLKEKEITEAKFVTMNAQLAQLQKEIDFKSQELTTYTLHLIQKNEALETLKTEIDELRQLDPSAVKTKLSSLTSSVNFHLHLDKDWENFRYYFDSVHQQFFDNLKNRLPDITPAETKLCALLRLRLNTKQIATIMGISAESVKTGRYRLRKRFGLETEQRLSDFLESI